MKRTIFLSIFALVAKAMLAQSPGYMGKHFQVYAALEPTFQIRPMEHEWEYYLDNYPVTTEYGKFGVGVNPAFGIEATLNKTFVAGVDIRFASSKAPIHMYYNETLDEDSPPAYFGEAKFKGMFTGFYMKIYSHRKHGFLAPIGRYHQFEFITGKGHMEASGYSTLDYYDLEYQMYYDEYNASDFTPQTSIEPLQRDPFKMGTIRYTFGSETVLFNNFPTDFGIQVTLPPSFWNQVYSDYSAPRGLLDYNYQVQQSMFASTFVGFTMRFGYFVF